MRGRAENDRRKERKEEKLAEVGASWKLKPKEREMKGNLVEEHRVMIKSKVT